MRNPTTTTRRNTRATTRPMDYASLEPRQLLAVTTMFDGATGSLNITMSEDNDVVVVDSSGGLVTINGSPDTNSSMNGVQETNVIDIAEITVIGNSSMSQQNVAFDGDFSSGVANLSKIRVQFANNVSMLGNYFLADSFEVELSQSGGGLGDGQTGRLHVSAESVINAGDNRVQLDNSLNDFGGEVSVTNSGIENDVVLSDVNDIILQHADVAGDLALRAAGLISDTDGASLTVGGIGWLRAESILLGEDASNTTNFSQVSFDATGAVELHEDSDTFIVRMGHAQSLMINSSGMIEDGRKSHIQVADQAVFHSSAEIRLGDRSSDLFNAGQIEFQSGAGVEISENSSTHLMGDSFASSLLLTSRGDISDGSQSTTRINGLAGLIGANIVLGDSAQDEFNAGSISFQTPGDFLLTEDSATHIAGRSELCGSAANRICGFDHGRFGSFDER